MRRPLYWPVDEIIILNSSDVLGAIIITRCLKEEKVGTLKTNIRPPQFFLGIKDKQLFFFAWRDAKNKSIFEIVDLYDVYKVEDKEVLKIVLRAIT